MTQCVGGLLYGLGIAIGIASIVCAVWAILFCSFLWLIKVAFSIFFYLSYNYYFLFDCQLNNSYDTMCNYNCSFKISNFWPFTAVVIICNIVKTVMCKYWCYAVINLVICMQCTFSSLWWGFDNYSKIIYAHFTANRFGFPAGGQFLQQANGAMLVQPRFWVRTLVWINILQKEHPVGL